VTELLHLEPGGLSNSNAGFLPASSRQASLALADIGKSAAGIASQISALN